MKPHLAVRHDVGVDRRLRSAGTPRPLAAGTNCVPRAWTCVSSSPAHPDSQFVSLSGFTFLPDLEKEGVQTWRDNEGFLHEKAILMDDDCGAVICHQR